MAGGATQIEMPAQVHVRERAVVALLSVCVFFSVLNTSMFNVSLPEIGREFETYRMLIFGAAMVLIMIWRPRGLLAHREPTLTLAGAGRGAGGGGR